MKESFKYCPKCNGKGIDKKGKRCYNCSGRGQVPDWSNDYSPEELKCNKCEENYWIPNRKCNTDWKDPLCNECFNKIPKKDYFERFKI